MITTLKFYLSLITRREDFQIRLKTADFQHSFISVAKKKTQTKQFFAQNLWNSREKETIENFHFSINLRKVVLLSVTVNIAAHYLK